MSDAPQALYAAVSYKKVPGTLVLGADGLLKWQPSSSSSSVPGFSVQDVHLKGLKVSKPGAAQTALRLEAEAGHTVNGESAAMLTFNAEPDVAVAAREQFKERLAAAIARARTSQEERSSTPADTPRTPHGTGTPEIPEVKLRGQVLLANPSLLALHKEVVGSEILSDADFWAHPTRAALLRSERAKMQQRQGRSAQLADPKPTQGESGEMKINITPQLIRELFEQYPVLTRAYNENVPEKLSESTFWARYFQSKLYHRLRTSQRSAASEQTLRDDPIFDQYLEEEDDGIEPRTPHNPHDALLNLQSTAEDHGETGNVQDWTMRAGFDRRTLPLVRRFNNHASSLLRSSLGELTDEDARRVRRKTGGVDEEYAKDAGKYYEQIVMDDLNEHRERGGRRLEIHDQKAYFEAGTEDAAMQDTSAPDAKATAARFDAQLQQWKLDIRAFEPPGKTMRVSLDDMLDNMEQQKEQHPGNTLAELPGDVHKQLISCHAATDEFLQQFWQSISPSLEGRGGTAPTLPERARKAKQMLQVLARTDARMESIADAADAVLPGTGRACVEAAFSATRQAVARAMAYGNSR